MADKATNLYAPPVADAIEGEKHRPVDDWPGAFGIYKYSRAAVMKNLGTLAIIYLTAVVLGFVLDQVSSNNKYSTFSSIFGLIVALPLTSTYLAGVHNKTMSIEQAVQQPVERYLKMIAVQILVTLAIVGSVLALIIPFFFVFPRLVLANYFVAEKDMDPVEAFKASWNKTRGHVGKVYGIVGASIVMFLPVFTIIGIPVAIYLLVMYSAATVVLYDYITRGK